MLSVSMLSANFGQLDQDCQMVNHSQASWFHLDIMDGVFVPNISYGFPVLEAIAAQATKPLDAHLMIVNPSQFYERLSRLGVTYLTVHCEACPHLHRDLQEIRRLGMKPGVALNPHTPLSAVEEILPYADMILLMSVNPGFGGQKFIDSTLSKIERLANRRAQTGTSFLIEVDGGIYPHNAATLRDAGANVLVAGNAIFRAPNPQEAILAMR